MVTAVIGNFRNGRVPGKDIAYPPQEPEFAAECRRMQEVLESPDTPKLARVPDGYGTAGGGRFLVVPLGRPVPDGFRTIGPERVNFGGRDLDLTSYTAEQRDWIIEKKRLPSTPDEIAEVEALAPTKQRMLAHG